MAVNLNINNQRQEKGSTLCGPMCVKMILDHIGMEESLEQISILCGWDKRGTFETSIALGLFATGVPALLITEPDGETVWPKYMDLAMAQVCRSFRTRSSKTKDPVLSRGLGEMAELMMHGLLEFGITTRKRIEEELDAGNPWIASVRIYELYDKRDENSEKRKNLQHFVIIQGYDEDHFIINDPAHGSEGGVYAVEKDRLLYSMYCADGSAMCVEVSNVADIRSDESVHEDGLDEGEDVPGTESIVRTEKGGVLSYSGRSGEQS